MANILLCIFSFFLGFIVASLLLVPERLKQKSEQINRFSHHLTQEYQQLLKKVEILSAIREISYSVNLNTDLDSILRDALKIMADLLPLSPRDTLMLWLRLPNGFVPKAMVVGSNPVTLLSNPTASVPPPTDKSLESFKDLKTPARVITDEQFRIYFPLFLETGLEGILSATFETTTSLTEAPLTEEKIREKEETLMEFTKVLSLALKTPALHQQAIEDGLTGLYNKRHFLTECETFLSLTQRTHQPLSLLIIDLDHFKRINDTYGHPVGDQVLKEVSATLIKNLRRYSTGYRYGGEELAILLPNTTGEDGYRTAERLRKKIEGLRINISPLSTLAGSGAPFLPGENTPSSRRESLTMTVSIGVAQAQASDSVESWIRRADQALYRAKAAGRNQVGLAGSGREPPASTLGPVPMRKNAEGSGGETLKGGKTPAPTEAASESGGEGV